MTCVEAFDHLARILLTCSEETKDKTRELEFAFIAEETNNEFKKLTDVQCDQITQRVLEQIKKEEEDD